MWRRLANGPPHEGCLQARPPHTRPPGGQRQHIPCHATGSGPYSKSFSAQLEGLTGRKKPAGHEEVLQVHQVREQHEVQEETEVLEVNEALVADLFNLDAGWSAEVLDGELDKELESAEESEEESVLSNPFLADWPDYELKKLEAQQAEANRINGVDKVGRKRVMRERGKVHRKLKLVGGTNAGARLYSPRGMGVRPMMERVRAAIFDMLLAQCGGAPQLPKGSRWLDLYAGTGAVGLEALSRGCAECHFIELDPWVVSNCLDPNATLCGCKDRATLHVTRAEDFLKRASQPRRFPQRPFDFISVCPPYLQVSYPELQDLLAMSGLIHANSFLFMEYPRQLKQQIRENLGPLVKMKDREYGRTYLAVYGPQ
eukprot:evm.model.scf_236.2 EVM.evm.TU.scf_236.2   scf_236:42268-51322(+)